MAKPLVGIIMGSTSDWETMQHAAAQLDALGVPYEKRVVSAHRTPKLMVRHRRKKFWPRSCREHEAALSSPNISEECRHMKTVKIIVEKHADGYVAYPVGIEGVVAGQGETFEAALQDVKSALKFHVETF